VGVVPHGDGRLLRGDQLDTDAPGQAGLSAEQGLTGGTLLNLGGIFGTGLLGVFAARWALRSVLVVYLGATAALLGLFVSALDALTMAFALGALIGLFLNGCIAGLYTLASTGYPAAVRTTGVGAAIGIGRIGAIVSPTVAGALLDAGWTPLGLYLAIGVLFVATACGLVLFGARKPAVPATAATV
jgi:MFS family permease